MFLIFWFSSAQPSLPNVSALSILIQVSFSPALPTGALLLQLSLIIRGEYLPVHPIFATLAYFCGADAHTQGVKTIFFTEDNEK